MNKFVWLTLVAVPAICCSSCSKPSESADKDVSSLKTEIKECIEQNKDKSDEELIEAFSDCFISGIDAITASVEDMSPEEKFAFIKKYKLDKSDVLEDVTKLIHKEVNRRTKGKSEEKVWFSLTKESKLLIVECMESFGKLLVTLYGDATVLKKEREWYRAKWEEEEKRWKAESGY